MEANLLTLLILGAMTIIVCAVAALVLSERVRELGLLGALMKSLAGDPSKRRYSHLIRR
jgi:hypothetical protein